MICDGADLARKAAKRWALSLVSIPKRLEGVHLEPHVPFHLLPHSIAGEVAERCKRPALSRAARVAGTGDAVAPIATGSSEAPERAPAIPMPGAVPNACKTRLDADTFADNPDHGAARELLPDTDLSDLVRDAVVQSGRARRFIGIDDPEGSGGAPTCVALLAEGDRGPALTPLDQDWVSPTLNDTSATTGRPEGVVFCCRGAGMNAVDDGPTFEEGHRPVSLRTLPLFHGNGRSLPGTVTVLAGTRGFRRARADAVRGACAGRRVPRNHPGGHIARANRAPDVLLSGGEGISPLELEKAPCTRPAENLVAVVAMPGEKWREVPCAFVGLSEDAADRDFLDHAEPRLVGLPRPGKIISGGRSKTTTGTIRKYAPRDLVRQSG